MSTIYGRKIDAKICRACLVAGGDVKFFEIGILSRFFTEYLNFETSVEQSWICLKCAHIVAKILRFSDQVRRVDRILLDALTKDGAPISAKSLSRRRRALRFDALSIHASDDPISVEYPEDSKEGIEQIPSDYTPSVLKEEQTNDDDQKPNADYNEEKSADGSISLNDDDDKTYKKKKKKTVDQKSVISDKITVISLTREQVIEEQNRLAMEVSYVNALYKCTLCYKGLATQETYNTHMDCHSEEFGEYACDVCRRRYKTRGSLRLHEANHTRRYRCNACGQRGVSREGLLRHYAIAHGQNDELPCAACDRTFKNLFVLQHHIRYTHKKKQRCQCQHCGKSFANKCSLRQHCIRKHSDDLPEGRRRHVCAVCGRRFLDVTNLREHAAKHSSARDFYCAECDASFKTRLALRTHRRSTLRHADPDKLVLCQHCPLKFADNRTLSRHVRDNHRPVAFKCDRCPKEYCGRSQLRTHARFTHEGHTPKRKYVCDACGRTFAYKSVMMDHMNTHTGSRPHKCGECPSDFGNAAALYRHGRVVHNRTKRSAQLP